MLHKGDCTDFLDSLEPGCASMCITSPPYNVGKEYESNLPQDKYIKWVSEVAAGIERSLSEGGSLFWQVGSMVDSGEVFPIDAITYPIFKSLGMRLRNRIVWTFGHGLHCKRRFSGRHETCLWFTKGDNYQFNLDDVRIPSKYPGKKHFKGPKKGQLSGNPLGKNPSDVWDIPNVKYNHPEKTDHPCQFPEELVRRAMLATTRVGDLVIDPFMGSGTTAAAALALGREWAGAEKSPSYWPIIEQRVASVQFEIF
jgi:adenine-specific DNA-methyltransferase